MTSLTRTLPFDMPEDYPRPHMVRPWFLSLDGAWDFDVSPSDTPPADYAYTITVPFPPESPASGIGRIFDEALIRHYRRAVCLDPSAKGERLLLHFGAVDAQATVTVDGDTVMTHAGGYEPFVVDLTERLGDGQTHILGVAVRDELSRHIYPYGKQRHDRGGMWYTECSGIWQSVFIERVPAQYVRAIHAVPDLVGVDLTFEGISGGRLLIQTPSGEEELSFCGEHVRFEPRTVRLWSPSDPYLYRFTLCAQGGDTLASYFALRTVSTVTVDGVARLALNGEPFFFHGLLDQGYFPESNLTPPDPHAYERDILAARALGFNTLRKHIKIEPARFYYDCDRLGMLVFQDMVNNGPYSFVRDTVLPTVGFKRRDDRRMHRDPKTRAAFLSHMEATVRRLAFHPSIVLWTIFNEGWGQFDSTAAYRLLKTLDDTRIVDSASGWFAGAESDVCSRHVYFRPYRHAPDKKPVLLSEFGGYVHRVEGHVADSAHTYGYGTCKTREDLVRAMRRLYEEQILPAAAQGLSGAILTQLCDVEDELNGLLTYDRAVSKLQPEEFLDISHRLTGDTTMNA